MKLRNEYLLKVKGKVRVKVKVTLVQALRLCTGRTAHRGSRGIALPFHEHGTRMVWGVSVTSRPLFPPGKEPLTIVQETVWAPGPAWTGAKNLTPTGNGSPYLLKYRQLFGFKNWNCLYFARNAKNLL